MGSSCLFVCHMQQFGCPRPSGLETRVPGALASLLPHPPVRLRPTPRQVLLRRANQPQTGFPAGGTFRNSSFSWLILGQNRLLSTLRPWYAISLAARSLQRRSPPRTFRPSTRKSRICRRCTTLGLCSRTHPPQFSWQRLPAEQVPPRPVSHQQRPNKAVFAAAKFYTHNWHCPNAEINFTYLKTVL